MDLSVRTVFDGYASDTRDRLLSMRTLIYDVAEATDGVGPLTETLKWGPDQLPQPGRHHIAHRHRTRLP